MSDVNQKLLSALKELLIDMTLAQNNMRQAALYDAKWEGCAEAIQPRVDAARKAVEEVEKERQSIPVAWHCANDIIGKHFFTTEWSQVEQLTESKNAAKWKITPLVPL